MDEAFALIVAFLLAAFVVTFAVYAAIFMVAVGLLVLVLRIPELYWWIKKRKAEHSKPSRASDRLG